MFTKGQAKTPGSGRKKGSVNKKSAAIKQAVEDAVGKLADRFEGDAYALAAVIYKNQALPLSTRMAAMAAAMPYERPRLSQIDMTHRSLNTLTDEDFFRAWDSVARFLADRGRPKLLEAAATGEDMGSATRALNSPVISKDGDG
jgi:hypothetical protein